MSEYEWIDDCFRVEEKRWRTWSSYNKEEKEIITSLTKEQCILATRFYLKGKQEGFEDDKIYEGIVGGKL
jgi:hypothetical protein